MVESSQSIGGRLSHVFVRGRRAFFKMSVREKTLALAFAFALLSIWFSWQLERQKALSELHSTAGRAEALQNLELGAGPVIRENYQRQISEIDLNALPTKDEVSGQIDSLVRRSGFSNFDFGQARTERGADLNFHTFQVVIQKATYEQIRRFTETVKSELPYVSLERVVIQAQARDDQFLDVRYVFKSIEYNK